MLKQIENKDKNKLNNLLQLYLHELSEIFKIDFNQETCTYKYDNIDKYFKDNNHKPYFIVNDNEINGFILLDILENKYEVSEMFVLNNYKNNKVGNKAATELFDMYKGNWIVKVVPNSPKAENFWIKTIKKYTNNNYEITHTGKYNRAELTFYNGKE